MIKLYIAHASNRTKVNNDARDQSVFLKFRAPSQRKCLCSQWANAMLMKRGVDIITQVCPNERNTNMTAMVLSLVA